MGGVGSGAWDRIDRKTTTASFISIDIRRWQREGLLEIGRKFLWSWQDENRSVASVLVVVGRRRLELFYQWRIPGGEWKAIRQPVLLDSTPCGFGNQRHWFLCPARNCGKRVALLYGARHFECRQCMGLCYPSQFESAADRSLRRAQNIRVRLGGAANVIEEFPNKPKWMRWSTYHRLREKSLAGVSQSLARLYNTRKNLRQNPFTSY